MSKIEADIEPRVFLLDPGSLVETRRRLCLGEADLVAADDRLLQDAGQVLDVGPFSVVDKGSVPPSGDRRDYMSQDPYWWPNAAAADGLPYIRSDEINPDNDQHDRIALGAMCSAVNTLALAYYFSDHELFAEHAALLLRTWFLDEATCMTPHLQYGQGVLGRCEGKDSGIIETLPFSWMLDAVGMLAASPSWSSKDQEDLETWFSRYLLWLLESSFGREQARQLDHHGIWYDVQVASIALFAGRADVAHKVLSDGSSHRIASQIERDGRPPVEPTKPRTLEYCTMNLVGLFDLATLGERAGLDLWHYETGDGRGIKKAFYWLAEHALDSREWPRQQMADFDQAQLLPLLRRGGIKYQDPGCEDRIKKLEGLDWEADRTNLLYPTRK
jgi:hypothetical protein